MVCQQQVNIISKAEWKKSARLISIHTHTHTLPLQEGFFLLNMETRYLSCLSLAKTLKEDKRDGPHEIFRIPTQQSHKDMKLAPSWGREPSVKLLIMMAT